MTFNFCRLLLLGNRGMGQVVETTVSDVADQEKFRFQKEISFLNAGK